jgi:hypothetical protein
MKGHVFPIQHSTEMTGFFAFLQLYVLAARVTFICAMSFDAFPLDIQTCLLQVKYSLIRISIYLSIYIIFIHIYNINIYIIYTYKVNTQVCIKQKLMHTNMLIHTLDINA